VIDRLQAVGHAWSVVGIEPGVKPKPFLQVDLQTVGPISTGLSSSVASSWKIAFGRKPAFGVRSADGRCAPSEVSCDAPLPVSVLMAELLGRKIAPIGDGGSVDALVAAARLERSGNLAKRLRGIAAHHGTSTLLFQHASRELISKYVLMELFAESCDGKGRVQLGELRRRYGPDLDRLIGYIGDDARPRHARLKQHEDAPFDIDYLDPTHDWLTKPACSSRNHMFANLVRAIVFEEMSKRPIAMPLLDAVAARYGDDTRDDVVVVRQHALASNVGLADRLARRRKLIGKDYSSSLGVMLTESLHHGAIGAEIALGVLEEKQGKALIDHHAIGMRGDLTPWYVLEKAMVKNGLTMSGGPIDRFQLIDEGAAGTLLLNDLVARDRLPKRAPNSISAVEGTRDGARQLRAANLAIPVVNAAESPVKLHLVSVLIAWSVVEEVERSLEDLRAQGLDPERHVLVVGYGSVGSMVAELFDRLGYRVTVKETDPTKSEKASAGFRTLSRVGEDEDFGFVVGCVGDRALELDEMKNLPSGTLLYSASSSTKEFPLDKKDGAELVEWQKHGRENPIVPFQGKRIAIGSPGFHLTHWNRVLKLDGRELMLMNSGFPINLNGHSDPIEGPLAELIRAIVQLASYQARKLPEGTVGLIDLDREGQRFIAEEWMKRVRTMDPQVPAEVMALLEEKYTVTMRELR
jgi:hypothetical protein